MSDGAEAQIEQHARVCADLMNEVAKVLVGQETMVARLLIGLTDRNPEHQVGEDVGLRQGRVGEEGEGKKKKP